YHGDGLLRSQFVEDFYGPIVYQQLQTVKEIFDPVGVFNPDKVVPAGNKEPARMSASLRYEEYQPRSIQTAMDFSSEEGFESLIEQCNGCSKCRTTGDGVMCPSYRGAKTEITSTRGRANLLRAAINGELDDDMLTSDWFQSEVLDLCLSCKACETECPTGVDMAKLKTEAKHQRHKEKGTSLQARIFGNVRVMNKIGSLTAPLANRLANISPARILGEAILGIDRRRSLPEFHRHTLYDWMDRRSTTNEQGTPIVLYPDCYTTYNQPEVGKAAVKLLERLGYRVEIGDFECCGRPALSQGLVETAAGHAETNRDRFAQLPDETPVVSVEPSCVSAVNEYDDLIDDVSTSVAVQPLSSFLLSEASAGQIELPEIGNKKSVAYHGHCHAKAKGWSTATKDLLERVGYDVHPLDSTCCGMAGAFGYQTEHYDLSIEIAAKTINQLEQLDVECIATNGASCTHQLVDHGYDPVHPIELL
ncbi:(Fe-S)-binding protein, partial [Haloferax sp. Atlit-12N]|uniref:(Fe-S)-binding protein n=1 Tax=Haloferax sp. Atlit-12N TaxID=2077203 RepID=UPI0018F3A081